MKHFDLFVWLVAFLSAIRVGWVVGNWLRETFGNPLSFL